MVRYNDYVSRSEVCRRCHNTDIDCGKEKCPVNKAPTADVVPKSEVEKIFEEIETIIDNNTYKSYLPNSSLWSKGYKIKQIIAEIAELKKKYTEEYHEIS